MSVWITLAEATKRDDHLDLIVNGMVGISGTLLGAFVSGFITRKLGREAKAADQRQEDVVASIYLRHQLIRIYSHAVELARDIDAGMARAAQAGSPHVSLFVLPHANFADDVVLARPELVAAERIGGNDLINLVTPLDAQHNALIEGFKTYSQQKQALSELWISTIPDDELEKGVEPDSSFYKRNKYRLEAQDYMVSETGKNALELYEDCSAALQALATAQGARLGIEYVLELDKLGEGKLELRSVPLASAPRSDKTVWARARTFLLTSLKRMRKTRHK